MKTVRRSKKRYIVGAGVIIVAIPLIANITSILDFLGLGPKHREQSSTTKMRGIVTSQNQSGGQTAHTIINNINLNKKRVIRREYSRQKSRTSDNLYLLRLTFQQSDGIWDAGTVFWMKLKLTGAYKSYEFVSGFPRALSDVTTAENAANGYIEFKTSTPPLNEPIVLEIIYEAEMNVAAIWLTPTENAPSS